jgi:metal-responsive CopG/Arc/MetJ family transcriptional regulator
MATKRINLNMPEELLEQLDEFAEKNYLTRTSAMIVLLSDGMNYRRAFEEMPRILNVFDEAKKQGLMKLQ